MFIRKILCLLIFTFCLSCGQENENIENTYKKGIINQHKVKKIVFDIDNLTDSFERYRYFDIYHKNNISLIAYNRKTHSIDVVDVLARKVGGHTKLEKEGPDGIGMVVGLEAISPDSIIVVDESKVSLINNKGQVLWKLRRDKIHLNEDTPEGYLASHASSVPHYNPLDQSLISYYLPTENKIAFENPILIKTNLTHKTNSFLPFHYPPVFKERTEYNPIYIGPKTCFVDTRIIINFANLPNIYLFDLSSNKTITYGGKSKLTDNYPEPMEPGADALNYMLKSIWFFKIIHDPYRKLYYRTHWGEMALSKNGGEINTYYDKPLFLSVFNESFDYLYETKLEIDSGICPELLIPCPEGLIVFPFKQDPLDLDNNFLIGYLISFS